MATGEAFYHPGGDGCVEPSGHTAGPWDPRFQHGGPPAALLARALEREAAGDGLRLARLTYEILGPVPLAPLRLAATLGRPGRRVRLVTATLGAADRPVMRASAWAVRPAPGDLPADTVPVARVPRPEHLVERDPTDYPEWNCGFLAATEWRFARGDYRQPGPAAAWVRPRVPLLPGEPMSPIQRIALTADSANGISAVLRIDEWSFIPPELTIHVLRPPTGDWLYLDADSLVRPDCVGLTTATVHDLDGPVARSAQALFIARRTD